MNTFQTNNKLTNYLKRKGFREISSLEEKLRGKRRFRKGYNRIILFDNEYCKLIDKGIVQYESDYLDRKTLLEFIKTGEVYVG